MQGSSSVHQCGLKAISQLMLHQVVSTCYSLNEENSGEILLIRCPVFQV